VGKLVSVAGTNRHNMCGVLGSYEMKGIITVDGQAAATDTWCQAAVIGRVGMGTGTLTLNTNGVLAGVAAMSNIATAVVQTYTGEYVGFYVGAWAGTDDFEIGLLIEDGKTTTGIDIGAATTGINFSGDMTYGINMTDSLSATDAILIAGANADAIHISGSNTSTALHISGDQAIGILYDVDAAATDGLKIAVDDGITLTTGINLDRTGTTGTCTTGISIDTDGTTAIDIAAGFTGTTGLNIAGTATDGIAISGACADAIHISGTNTVSGLHISGDQAIGILYDVDAAATDGIKIAVDDSVTLTTGINIDRTGTTGICTTGISIDTDGTTGIEIAAGFTGTDMIVLAGTASGYGIEISGTCTTADLILQDGGLINDGATPTGGSGDALAITQDMIQLTGQVEIGYTDWGAAGAGAIQLVEASGWDWAFQANACLGVDVTGTAVAAAYHSNTITVTQTGSTSAFGTWTELYFSDSVDFSAADNAAAVWAQVEVGDDVSVPATSGDFLAGVYANVKSGETFTTGANSVVNGVRVKGEIDTTTISHAGRLAAFECLTESGDQPWDYGLYIDDATTGIYVEPGATYGIQVGAAATAAGSGLTVNATAPIGFYFDDGGAALTAWSECFTVGLVLPTASTGAAQTGFPSATHIYIDQRANYTGPAAAGQSMTTLWAGYLVRNSATLDGFDDGHVSAMQCSLDIGSGSTLAAGTSMAGIAFGGNWSLGTVSGTLFPLLFSTVNADWTGFAKFVSDGEGLIQDAAAGSGGHKYLKVYIGSTLYTIDMVTA